ncbi:MAG: sodium:pantothenate symporter [Gammaproteobacteria bacterium]|nr:sodium:pantothenate symporter [Gammaproteobacteria bacterium]
MDLATWSWIFLVLYVGAMVGFGWMGSRQVANADDFATARGAYGPFFLALAFAATTASGATFLGSPALAYQWGMPAVLGNVLYPISLYFGVLVCMRLIATSGNRFGNRSIPEYLGDRYQSDGIRILVSVFSLMLLFYLAGQLVSGLVMFETMLGLSDAWALGITTVVLMVYVTMGGAHADILTDGVQGALMLVLGAVVIVLFVVGAGFDGGLPEALDKVEESDPRHLGFLNEATPLYHSWWAILAILFAHMPLGLLPHIGNKLWALKGGEDQRMFVKLAFMIGLIMAMLVLAGVLARGMFDDALLQAGANPNEALPKLFIELFPTWLAALIGVGVLCAVMSTADGLVISSSQIVANDLYRRSIAPRIHPDLPEEEIDRRVLSISRWSTVIVLAACAALAWALMDYNIALIVWIGVGGMMAAFAGPLVLGALWRGVTRTGAYAGLVSGMTVFIILHSGILNPDWFSATPLFGPVSWLKGEAPNPFSCSAMGEIVSVAVTYGVSRVSKPLPEQHLDEMFGGAAQSGEAPVAAD